MKKSLLSLVFLALFLIPANSNAYKIYIGDPDGFGFGSAPGYNGVNGEAADRNNSGLLDSGDLLPDLNGDGVLAAWYGDDFDNRSAAEKSGSAGVLWTDVSLSNSFPSRPGKADDASFTFTFTVTPDDPGFGRDHIVNFVFADYDMNPMYATVEGQSVTLLGNDDGGGLDGFIWRAFAPVAWNDMLDGLVTLDIYAPNEPYVAFDYALLDVKPIDTNPSPAPVPPTVLLFATGLLGLAGMRRKHRKE